MPFAYYDRLSAARRRTYRKSDAITSLGLPADVDAGALVTRLGVELAREDRAAVQRTCQQLIDALVQSYRVPPVRVKVLTRRPTDEYGELHGFYEPGESRLRACITVWMRTAKRRQVVAFRSFLRTLVHELVHHLDYELFMLDETFHTEGFYKREANLSNALFAQAAAAARAG